MKTYSVRFHIPVTSGHPYVSSTRLVKALTHAEAETKGLKLIKETYPSVPPRYIIIDRILQMTEEPEL